MLMNTESTSPNLTIGSGHIEHAALPSTLAPVLELSRGCLRPVARIVYQLDQREKVWT